MSYQLGTASKRRLKGVHPELVKVVKKAILYTTQDFSVTSGVRTRTEQKELVRIGASKTMNSMHLVQKDGFGHAVDLVPYANGGPRWEWPLIYPVALAVNRAAKEVGLVLRWGGVWDVDFNDFGHQPGTMKKAVADYCVRHAGPDFIDGPHYEIQ